LKAKTRSVLTEMRRVGDDPRLKQALDRARTRPRLPSADEVDRKTALALIESCRQGTAPTEGALTLAVGREDLLSSMRTDLVHVTGQSSRLRVINGEFGMGKTLTLRLLQEFAHGEGCATSFVVLSSRECPMYDLGAVYRHIVRSIRVAECVDRPALEYILENWAVEVRESAVKGTLRPWAMGSLDRDFKTALTQYYEGVHFRHPQKADIALRWFQSHTTASDNSRLRLSSSITGENALKMLGNFTLMLRFMGLKGMCILLDETDAISDLPDDAVRETAYANLLSLARAAATTPYSYFVYATTPGFLNGVPAGYDGALGEVTQLEQLRSRDLIELSEEIRDLHFRAYDWCRDDLNSACLRRFVLEFTSTSVRTPRAFVRTLVAALDACEENEELTLHQIMRRLS